MEVRAKKALGQHFLTDLSIAQRIADALTVEEGQTLPALEVGPGMGVLTQYLLKRPEVDLRMVEIDTESVNYLLVHFPQVQGKLLEADFLKLKLENFFSGQFAVIGNFPYNISSQIFFKILDYKEQVPQVVCMIQKEVAERIAEKPGTKTYGILSVLLQAWYDIEYLFTVGEGAFNPPPKVKSAVIRLVRNQRTELGCDEGVDQLHGLVVRDESCGQNQYVGVVVLLDKLGNLLAPYQTGAYALVLVERHSHALA